MPPTRKEYLSSLRGEVSQAKEPVSSLLKSAAVNAEKLTGSPEWDRFLEKVQARRNELWAQYQNWIERLEQAGSDEAVKQCQINAAIHKNCAFVLDEIMGLPQELIKAHHGNV